MRRVPVFQTDDLFDNPGQFVGATCDCETPRTNWKGPEKCLDWRCLTCNKIIRGEKREAIRFAVLGPPKVCQDHHPRTGPVNSLGVIPNKWRCPNCNAPIGKAKWKAEHP